MCALRAAHAPPAAGVGHWPCEIENDLDRACRDVDALICLRLQRTPAGGLLPDLSEYARRYCLDHKHLRLALPGARVLHPGR